MQWSAPFLTQAPVALPVEVPTAREHVRGDTDDDALIGFYLASAVMQAENATGLFLITSTVQISCPMLERRTVLPIAPVQSLVIGYLDPTGTAQVVPADTYIVSGLGTTRPIITLRPGCAWPTAMEHPEAFTVTAICGYGDSGDAVPAPIKQAILLLVGDYYANREDTIAERSVTPATLPNGVTVLLSRYEVW